MRTEYTRTQTKLWGFIAGLTVLAAATPIVRAQSDNTLQVGVGQSVTLAVDNVAKLAVADPAIADVVPLSEREVSIIGKKMGATTLSIVRSDNKPTQIYRVEVGNDAIATTIRKMISSPSIRVKVIGDSILLDGTVTDEIEAQRAAQIAAAFKMPVVNLLEVQSPRQIRIRTRVAEVNSEVIKNVGFRWFGPGGEVQYALDFKGGGSIIHGLVQPASSKGTAPTDPTAVGIGADVILQLLLTKGYARLLSEPTLVTMSGKEASFLVGQEVPIVQQLPQSFTVEFKEVGVRMKVKPTADSQNQINTIIHAEVSQVVGSGANGIPIIGAKTADSTLQVRDGQTVVIGGLLENNINRDYLRKVPYLADIPIFGFLFRQKEHDAQQREVLFFMTPEIVKDVDLAAASAARTPVMKEWNDKKASTRVLEVPRKGYDWGLYNLDGLGLSAPESSGAKAEPKSKAQPGVEPTQNFSPAQPGRQLIESRGHRGAFRSTPCQ